MIDEKLLKEVTEKANQWLGEGYDEETKAEVKRKCWLQFLQTYGYCYARRDLPPP